MARHCLFSDHCQRDNIAHMWKLLHTFGSLEPGSPPARKFQFACKKGESLVYFDHVLDVVGRRTWFSISGRLRLRTADTYAGHRAMTQQFSLAINDRPAS